MPFDLRIEVKYFSSNIFFLSVCLHVKYGQICKIFFIDYKIICKKLQIS